MINLAQFLLTFPTVKLASASDEKRLRTFFHAKKMSTKSFYLSYNRDPDFFSFLKLQGEDSYVFFVESDEGVIEGCGTLTARNAIHKGKPCLVGYLADLRIDNVRKWGRVWRDFYEALIAQAGSIEKLSSIKIFYTCLLVENSLARNSLVSSKNNLSYTHFHNYKMVNVFSQLLPVFELNLKTKNWNEIAKDELNSFLHKNSMHIPHSYRFDDEINEISRRLKSFPDYSNDKGIGIYQSGKLIGVCSFWSPRSCKKIFVHNLSKGFKLLAKWIKLPANDEELKCLYIANSMFKHDLSMSDRHRCLRLMIAIGLKQAKKEGFHCLSLSSFEISKQLKLAPTFIAHETELAMYLVHNKFQNMNNKLEEYIAPAFEIGLI